MAHTILTVDNITLLDDNLDEWQAQPPPDLQALLKPADPQPWHRTTMIAIAESLLKNEPVHIDITTHTNGWTLTVTKP